MSNFSSLFQDENLSFLAYLQYFNLDIPSNDSEPHIQVENLDNHHRDILIYINTYGGEYKSILDGVFSSSKGLDLQGIDLEFISHSLQSPFMNFDSLLI